MTILNNRQTYVERDGRSAVHSHQKGYSDRVQAICHHSGRYLTRGETNPTRRLFLREQHDFPGLPKLDRAFAKAAHSFQHEHWIWSRPAIKGTALILSGVVVLLWAVLTAELRDFVTGGVWVTFYWIWLVLAIVGSIALIGYGLILALRREKIFHKRAEGLSPAIPDFPVKCAYEVQIHESVEARMGNTAAYPDIVEEQNGRITAAIIPIQNDLETFDQYREQYRNPNGKYAAAGAIALGGLDGIELSGDNIDFDHRFILRAPASNLTFDEKRETYKSFPIRSDYTLTPSILYRDYAGMKQFPLQCEPKVAHDDSRTLELAFTWQLPADQPPNDNLRIVLEACVLDSMSDDRLKPVTAVKHGRYDPDAEKVIWRNLAFQKKGQDKWGLSLYVTFEYPILNCLELISGAYTIKMNGLVSNIDVSYDHIWTAWGLKAKPNDCIIHKKATLHGQLQVNPQLLSQEHEHVTDTEPIVCQQPPNEDMVRKIIHILQDEGFELQRVAQAPPHLHPTGRLDAKLQYWDIVGRHYDRETLDAIDVHVVIAGREQVSSLSAREKIQPRSNIDIHLRCLHDPRNRLTPEHADTLIGTRAANGQKLRPHPTPDLPFHLQNHLREVLLNCGPFTQGRELRAVFADGRINAWQNQLPDADTAVDRAESIINLLFAEHNQAGENALILLLQVLQDRLSPQDMCYQHLNSLIDELKPQVPAAGQAKPRLTVKPDEEMYGLVNRIKQELEGAS